MTTGILVDVVMPQMGVSVSEGTITRWAKGVGDTIAADETVVEISTDKVDTEIPSPASGVIREILAEEGDTVPVNTRIAVIDTGGGSGGDEPEAPAAPAPAVTTPAERVAAAPPPPPAAEAPPAPEAAPAPPAQPAAETNGANGSNGSEGQEGRSFVSPVVARMLAEHNLDIDQIPGTGTGGRVTKRDVRQFVESGGAAAAPPAAPAPPAASEPEAAPEAVPEVHDVPHFSASLEDAIVDPAPAPPAPPEPEAEPAPPAAAPPAPAPVAAAPAPAAPEVVQPAAGAREELYRFSTIRKVIARHMRHSLETAAQVTTVVEVDMTSIVEMRARWKAEYKERHGVNLTYIPFVALATLDAISDWPWLNAEVQGETAIIKSYVNLGMAVAVDDSKGLMVPVIRDADEKNLVGLSRSVVELAGKARTKTLTPDEMSGGTFTITNPGVFGALIGTPIIPEGQVGILDVETIVKRAVVITDEHGNDAIGIRSMMFLCLSYDHRLVDGAYAAQFMRQIKQNLETWDEGAFGL